MTNKKDRDLAIRDTDIFRDFVLHGLTQKEISKKYNITQGAVSKAIKRCQTIINKRWNALNKGN